MINPPTLSFIHPDRARECEGALEEEDFALLNRGRGVLSEEFHALAKRAQAVGWLPEEITAALLSLAQKYVQAARSRRSAATPTQGRQRLGL
jgi:hypothetical protein